MRIREFQSFDVNQIITLFYKTVHSVNAVDYSIEQLNAWLQNCTTIAPIAVYFLIKKYTLS